MEHVEDSTAELNATYYDNKIRELFKEYAQEYGYTAEIEKGKLNGNHAQAVLMRIYKDVFKPDHKTMCNKQSNLDYANDDLLLSIQDTYISIATEYNFLATAYGYSNLTGINADTLYEWAKDTHRKNPSGASCKRSDLIKRFRNNARSQLHQELYSHPIGVQSLANNEREFGLNYNQQRLLDGAITAQALSVGELPKLSELT